MLKLFSKVLKDGTVTSTLNENEKECMLTQKTFGAGMSTKSKHLVNPGLIRYMVETGKFKMDSNIEKSQLQDIAQKLVPRYAEDEDSKKVSSVILEILKTAHNAAQPKDDRPPL